jgi:hypothetical protein
MGSQSLMGVAVLLMIFLAAGALGAIAVAHASMLPAGNNDATAFGGDLASFLPLEK